MKRKLSRSCAIAAQRDLRGMLNDHKRVGSAVRAQPRTSGRIDFGERHDGLPRLSRRIAAAYGHSGKEDPLQAADASSRLIHGAFQLDELELSVLYALIGARLAVSVTNYAHRKTI